MNKNINDKSTETPASLRETMVTFRKNIIASICSMVERKGGMIKFPKNVEIKLKFDSLNCDCEMFEEVKPQALFLCPDRNTTVLKYEMPEWSEGNSHYVPIESESETVESDLALLSLDELFNIISVL